jgi:hypothetical protein
MDTEMNNIIVDIHTVKDILYSNGMEDIVIQTVIEELIKAQEQPVEQVSDDKSNADDGVADDAVTDGDDSPKVKKQFVIVLSDPNKELVQYTNKLVGWVGQISAEADVNTYLPKLYDAAYEFNRSKKGRKYPIKTVGDAMDTVQAKLLKKQGISIKTKEPVLILLSDNVVPTK